MDCNFELCPAKTHLAQVDKRLDSGNHEFEQMRKDLRELSKRNAEIANNQTKISADLVMHMARSEDKHQQVLSSITLLSTNLDKHTEDEMNVQRQWLDELSSVKGTLKEHTKTLKYIVYVATAIGLFLWDYIKAFADMFIKSLLGL